MIDLSACFSSYDKIPESPKKWGLSEQEYRQLKRVEWVVTEKIHGANFAILTDGDQLQCAKRKALLEGGDDFFGYRQLLPRIEEAVLWFWMQLHEADPSIQWVALYGELFGGGYPHPAVAPDPLAQPVQPGIYYSPQLEFCAFDARVGAEGDESGRYLDYAELWEIAQEVGLMAAEPLFVGSFEQACQYEERFETTIPGRLGWPSLTPIQYAEGVVIKPHQELLFVRGQRLLRPVLKKKIPDFAEDIRQLPDPGAGGPSLPAHATNADLLRYEMQVRVTPARLQAAISKMGRWKKRDRKQRKALVELFVEDILDEVRDEHSSLYLAVQKAEKRGMIDELRQAAEGLLDEA